jgi:uncharacterized protein (DUF302 family)
MAAYAFEVVLSTDVETAIARLTDALKAEKLGIVSDVDVAAILKKKLDKDVPPYRILGACAPGLALRVIEAEPNAGTLLPCNVVVRGTDEGSTVVAFMDPVTVLELEAHSAVRAVADEAKAILERVVTHLKEDD